MNASAAAAGAFAISVLPHLHACSVVAMSFKHPTKHVAIITVTDPDSGQAIEMEIRKDMQTGLLVGLDGTYLEQLDGSPEDANPASPYDDDTALVIPDDEEGPARRLHVVNPEDAPLVVFEWLGEGKTPEEIALDAFNNIQQADSRPVCTVIMPNGKLHTVDLEHVSEDTSTAPVDQDTEEKKVEEIEEGDYVDLESCPHLKNHESAAFEFCYVYEVRREGSRVVISYDGIGGEYAYDLGTTLKVQRKGGGE